MTKSFVVQKINLMESVGKLTTIEGNVKNILFGRPAVYAAVA